MRKSRNFFSASVSKEESIFGGLFAIFETSKVRDYGCKSSKLRAWDSIMTVYLCSVNVLPFQFEVKFPLIIVRNEQVTILFILILFCRVHLPDHILEAVRMSCLSHPIPQEVVRILCLPDPILRRAMSLRKPAYSQR